jgi:hypothetical protein
MAAGIHNEITDAPPITHEVNARTTGLKVCDGAMQITHQDEW